MSLTLPRTQRRETRAVRRCAVELRSLLSASERERKGTWELEWPDEVIRVAAHNSAFLLHQPSATASLHCPLYPFLLTNGQYFLLL